MIIEIIENTTGGQWKATCTICGWKTKWDIRRDVLRQRAAAHLWAKRNMPHEPGSYKSKGQQRRQRHADRMAEAERKVAEKEAAYQAQQRRIEYRKAAEKLRQTRHLCPHPEKRVYVTHAEGMKVRQKMLKEGHGNADLLVYRCPGCSGFHIGHSVRSFKKRIKEALR